MAHISNTMKFAFNFTTQASDAQVAAIFAFGREDIIPGMFAGLVNDHLAKQFSIFKFYLERHIELDGDDHGPMALRLVRIVCGSDAQKWHKATEAVNIALGMRVMIWQAVLDKHKAVKSTMGDNGGPKLQPGGLDSHKEASIPPAGLCERVVARDIDL